MVILRASQPLTGQSNRRCKEDERLVNAVLGIGRRGYIVDTRSQSVATKGKRSTVIFCMEILGEIVGNIIFTLTSIHVA